MSDEQQFCRRLLAWFDRHGRKDLPWQRDATPYRVWVSEIMLQQTQVATVIPYYQRFMDRFPSLARLAGAHLDEVLQLWSGLGYYARARNLHRAAIIARDRYACELPNDLEQLVDLPGIGRSTAGAILALAHGQRQPILDGNVKRVLARFATVAGWPGHTKVQTELWRLAERYTPTERLPEYTQAIMDLGATVCRRRLPLCAECPLSFGCRALASGEQAAYPGRRPQRQLPVRATRMLLLCDSERRVFLQQRPPTGIWGGLWSFPEAAQTGGEIDLSDWCRERFGLTLTAQQTWPLLRHTFSHFHLDITPVQIDVATPLPAVADSPDAFWHHLDKPLTRGLAAPIQHLLERLANVDQ